MLELNQGISEIKQQYLEKHGRTPSATDIILIILKELGQATPVIHILWEQLDLKPTKNFKESIYNTKLQDSLVNTIDQQMVYTIASRLNESVTETEQTLINISSNSNLLPQEILDVISDKVSLSDLEKLDKDNNFIKKVKAFEKQLVSSFDTIICVDKSIHDFVKELGQTKDVHFIPNSVDVNKFKYKPLPKGKNLIITYIGRPDPNRGFDIVKKFSHELIIAFADGWDADTTADFKDDFIPWTVLTAKEHTGHVKTVDREFLLMAATTDSDKGRVEIGNEHHAVVDSSGLCVIRPANNAGHAHTTFECSVFCAPIRFIHLLG